MGYKNATALILAATLLGGSALAAAPVDVQRHWAGGYINTLLNNETLVVYADERFRPDQAATLGMTAAGLEKLLHPAEQSFLYADMGTAAAETRAIRWLADAAGLDCRADGREAPLKRAELAEILYRCWQAERLPLREQTPVEVPCTDLEGVPEAEAIRFLLGQGIFNGRPDGRFGPGETVTRAELAATLCRVGGLAPVVPEVGLPAKTEMAVPYSSQIYPLYAWVGCEPTALYMAMRYKGALTDVELKAFLDALPLAESNPARGFVGSPYVPDKEKKTRTTIYPPVLAEYGRAYGADVQEFSGSSPSELQAELLAGNPVVVYVTLDWAPVHYRDYIIDGETQNLVSNNHAVLVTGYNTATGQYHITDPYNLDAKDKSAPFVYWEDGKLFDELYNIRRHALVIRG